MQRPTTTTNGDEIAAYVRAAGSDSEAKEEDNSKPPEFPNLLNIPSETRIRIWRYTVEYGQEPVFCPRRHHPDDALGPNREATCLSVRQDNPLLGLLTLSRRCFNEVRPLGMIQYTQAFCCIECAVEWLRMASVEEKAKFDRFDVFADYPCDGKTCVYEPTIDSVYLDAYRVRMSEFLIETGRVLQKLEAFYLDVKVVEAFTFEAGMLPHGIFEVGKPITARVDVSRG